MEKRTLARREEPDPINSPYGGVLAAYVDHRCYHDKRNTPHLGILRTSLAVRVSR